jgi:hypothetical protein
MRSEDGYGAPEERYPPECLDGVFCELCLDGVSTKFAWRRSYAPNGRVDWRRRRSITGGNHSDGSHRSGLRQDGDAVPEGGAGEAGVLTLLPHGRGAKSRTRSLLEGGYAEEGPRGAPRYPFRR